MKLTLLKLSTILMLTFGTAMGADDVGASEASGDEKCGKHLAVIVNTGGKIGAGVLCGCNATITMTLSELLNKHGIKQTDVTKITIFKSPADNGSYVLTPEELEALGFTPDQNLGTLPLGRFDALELVRGVTQPPYFLSIIGTVSDRKNVLPQFISLLESLSRLIDQALVAKLKQQ